MQDLKKYAAIGGAVALVAIWPLAVGHIGQKVVENVVQELNGNEVQAEVVSYQRGYLSSDVRTRYKIIDPVLAEQLQVDGIPTELTVSHEISHGLLGIDAISKPVGLEALPLTLISHTQLNGNTDFTLVLENLYFEQSDNLKGSVSFARSQLTGSATVLGDIDFTFDFPSIQLKFDSGDALSFTHLNGSGQGKKVNGFWQGDQKVSLDAFSLESAQGEVAMSGKNMTYHANSEKDEEAGRIHTNHTLTADQFVSPDGVIDNLSVDFTLGDLDAVSFEHLVSIYNDGSLVEQDALNQSAQHIDNLFNKGFHLSMNQMKLALGEGVFDSKWNLVVPQGTANVTQDMSKVIPALTGKLDTFISNGLIAEYPFIQESIDELVIMEMITPVDDGYKIDATVKGGEVVFASGQKMPLIALLLPLMAQ